MKFTHREKVISIQPALFIKNYGIIIFNNAIQKTEASIYVKGYLNRLVLYERDRYHFLK